MVSCALYASEKSCTELCILHWAPAGGFNSCKRAPRILFQPIGLRLTPTNQSCTATCPYLHLHWPVKAAPLQPIRRMLSGPIKLCGFGVLICMGVDWSGTRTGIILCVSRLTQPHWKALFSVGISIRDHYLCWTCVTRARARAVPLEQGCLTRAVMWGPLCPSCSRAMLCSSAVSLLSCWHWVKSPPTTPQTGDPCWH